MALSKRYYSVKGEMLYEKGASRVDYLPDALGSIAATTVPGSPNTVENTYRMKPYGSTLVKTGAGSDSRFRWLGTIGYRRTNLFRPGIYVRARHYSQEDARWTTVDPLWPAEPSYAYSFNPVLRTDPSGLKMKGIGCKSSGQFSDFCDQLNKCLSDPDCKTKLLRCVGPTIPPGIISDLLDKIAAACNSGGDYCFICDKKLIPSACNPCGDKDRHVLAETYGIATNAIELKEGACSVDVSRNFPFPYPRPIGPSGNSFGKQCAYEIFGNVLRSLQIACKTITIVCDENDMKNTFFHELAHAFGLGGDPGDIPPKKEGKPTSAHDHFMNDIVYRFGNCLSKNLK